MSTANEPNPFDSWAVLELMGHVRMAGRVTEEERFGCKMGRIDVPTELIRQCGNCGGSGDILPADPGVFPCPICDGKGTLGGGFTTVYFGGGSVYRMTPTTEAVARAVAKGSQPEPVHRWELPSPEKAAKVFADRIEDDDQPEFDF